MNWPTEPSQRLTADTPAELDAAVLLQHVSVCYKAPAERLGTFKEYAIRRIQRRVRFTDFLALRDVDLRVEKGEIFGIIGRNGAGKSTLLKVVSRVIMPTSGRVRIQGTLAPLLELGAGFHPELTGMENVLLNGTLLGHSIGEMQSKMEGILEFAELGAFIEAPLRTYSSGMVARLGFAVATAWQPEILLLDEVLAVGDEAFRQKCHVRMQSFRQSGTTILMVTHDMAAVSELCTRAAWLEHGKIAHAGPTSDTIGAYRAARG
jgi:homopolymeric O-antigen transport system ATP-binding protein